MNEQELNESGTLRGTEVVEDTCRDIVPVEVPEEGSESPQSLVKRGRPPGSKNKDTLFKELMTGNFQAKAIKDIERTYEVLFEQAHAGDMKAIKMILDRVVPVTKAVDASAIRGGITVSINVGSMEEAAKVDVIEGEFEESES